MDTSLNLNQLKAVENESKPTETAGTIAQKPTKLFTQTTETAGVVASNNAPSASTSSASSSSGGSISALA